MMEETLYSNFGGMGLILSPDDTEADYIAPESVAIADTVINPGEFTTLCGKFTKPLRYVGMQKSTTKLMVFHAGDNSDLFDTKRFYYVLGYLTNTRIYNCYSPGTARDFNLKNGAWK